MIKNVLLPNWMEERERETKRREKKEHREGYISEYHEEKKLLNPGNIYM